MCKIQGYSRQNIAFSHFYGFNSCKIGNFKKKWVAMDRGESRYQSNTNIPQPFQSKSLTIWKNKLSEVIFGQCRVSFLAAIIQWLFSDTVTLLPVKSTAQSLVFISNLMSNYLNSTNFEEDVVKIEENSAIDCGSVRL
jgi:hypothetical protein